MSELRIFGLKSTAEYAREVAGQLGLPLADHQEKFFADGEAYFRANVNVRGRDVFVIQSLYSGVDRAGERAESINDRLLKLLIAIGSLRDASADRITAVIPYLGYARQDRKVQSREPISTRYAAQILESVGVDRVLTIDVHNLTAFQNSFRCRTDMLEAKKILANRVHERLSAEERNNLVIVSDIGGISRTDAFRSYLSRLMSRPVGLATAEKSHKGDAIAVNNVIGDVSGKTVVILDDMVSSGKTVRESVQAIERAGGRTWGVAATHGLFVGKALGENLGCVPRLILGDTIDRLDVLPAELRARTEVISTGRLVAEAIRRIHEGTGSISDLLT